MYKAPIDLTSAQRAEYKFDTEKMVIEAVYKTGVNVDKDELIRALQYDRDQYDKGYADGKADGAREIFEEIEKHDCKPLPQIDPIYVLTMEQLAELKKKHTGGET